MQIPENWSFEDANVAAGFDAHVREQLPWYDLVTNAITHIARHYIPEHGLVFDIGCSTGNISLALKDVLVSRKAEIIGIESSEEMAGRFHGYGKVVHADALQYHYPKFDVAILNLVLMFMPVDVRQEYIRTLYNNIRHGGVMIVVDKCEPMTGYASVVMSRLALAEKVRAGVNAREIIEKELSLSGVQRPLNPAILGSQAKEFFRFGDFAGWIIEK